MKLRLWLILLVLTSTKSDGQQFISNWKSYDIPTSDSALSYNSRTTWFVSLSHFGEVQVEEKIAKWPSVDTLPFKPYFDTMQPYRNLGFRVVKRVSNGYLLGFNKGEFGGGFYWFSANGDSSYKISNGLVNYVFELNSHIYMASGLLHVGDYGQINEMILENGRWKISEGVDISNCPKVYLPHRNGLLIVTSTSVLLFKSLKEITWIRKDGFWDILYPQSAVIVKDDLYVGMRGGVYKINMKTSKESWLMPD